MIGISEVGPGIKGRTVRVVSALPIPVGIICIQPKNHVRDFIGRKIWGGSGKNWLDGGSIQVIPSSPDAKSQYQRSSRSALVMGARLIWSSVVFESVAGRVRKCKLSRLRSSFAMMATSSSPKPTFQSAPTFEVTVWFDWP